METTQLAPTEFGLQEKQVKDVDMAFSKHVKEREILSAIYSQLIEKDITKEVSMEARELRLKAVKIKSGITSIHKTQKAFALSFGRYCDAWKNKEIEPVQQIIDGAMEIEKFEELQEKRRLDELQDKRAKILSEFVEDAYLRDLSKFEDDEFEAFVELKKKQREEELKAEEEARKAAIEEQRLNKLETQRRIEVAQYAQYDVAPELEDYRGMSERDYQSKLLMLKEKKKIYDEKVKKQQLENERLQKIADAEKKKALDILEKGKAAKAEFDAKLKAIADAEAKKIAEAKAAAEAELAKGDEEKMQSLIKDLKHLQTKYVFESEINKALYARIVKLIDKLIGFINE